MPELPPSERDFLVFEALAFGGASTRQAAAEFDISQTRVMQIRKQVAQWIATSVPDGLNLTPIQRLRLAAHIAQGRVDFLYSQAMEAWRQSQKPATSICRGRLTGETRTTRDSHGEPRYLLVAARIAERQLQLAGTARKVLTEAEEGSKFKVSGFKSSEEAPQGDARDGDAREGEALVLDQRAEPRAADDDQTSPVRDCSPNLLESRLAESEQAEADDATDLGDEACNDLENRRRAFLAALRDDTAPVHPPFTDAGGMLLDASEPAHRQDHAQEAVIQLQVNGQQLGAAVSTTAVAERPARVPLNRHERRARQRELERLRRRAK